MVEVPDVQGGVHVVVGRVHLQTGELVVPIGGQGGEAGVHAAGIRVSLPCRPGLGQLPLAQEEEQAHFLAGGQGQPLAQGGAVVAGFSKAAGQFPALHSHRAAFVMIQADECIPQGIEAVGLKIGGEELIAELFIKQIVQHRPVLVGGAGGVIGHLKILVVHLDVVVRPFHIGVHAQPPWLVRPAAKPHVPQLHRIPQGDEHRLARLDLPVIAGIGGIGQAVAAGIRRLVQRLAHRLPGNRPVFPRFVVPDIHVMAGPVQRHPVGPEPGHPVVLRRFVERVAARGLVEHRAVVVHADVIGPGGRGVHPIDDIFAAVVVKISVLQKATLLFHGNRRFNGIV